MRIAKKPRLCLVAGLAEEAEHVFLIRLHAGLVEGVDAGDIARHAAGILEEVDKRADGFLADFRQTDFRHRHAAGDVRGLGRLHGLFVDIAHFAAGKVVEPVEVLLVKRHGNRRSGLVKEDDRLLQHSSAFLHILPHRMKIGREVDGGRENAGLVFAFRLAVQLLPPLGHEPERGLVGS